MPDFLPPDEPGAPLSPLLGLAFTDLYFFFVEEKTDLFFFLLFFFEIEWPYNLLFDFPLGGFEENIFGPFLDFPEKASLFFFFWPKLDVDVAQIIKRPIIIKAAANPREAF